VLSGATSVSNLFDPEVRGRVSPLGNFLGTDLLSEYFYGLAAVTFQVRSIDIQTFAWNQTTDTVTTKVNLLFFSAWGFPAPYFNLTQFATWSFKISKKTLKPVVQSFDADILNLGWALDTTNATLLQLQWAFSCAVLVYPDLPTLPPQISFVNTPLYKTNGTCPGYWPGTTQQDKFNYCYYFYSTQIPVGSYSHANSNTYVCREIHTLLTPYNPTIHCPHASVTGGDACVDTPYSSYYDQVF